MFLIAPSTYTIGYAFGNFLIIYIVVYVFVLGRNRQQKNPQGYYKRILASALIVGLLYSAFNQAKVDDYSWKAALFIAATLAALSVSVVDTWRPFSAIRVRVVSSVGNGLAVLVAVALSSFVVAAAYENGAARRDFVDSLRRSIATNPSGDILAAVIDTSPDLYDKFLPYLSNDRLRSDRAAIQKTSTEIFGGYLANYFRRFDDAAMAVLLSLSADLMLAAYAEAPAVCIEVQNSSIIPTQARTPRLQAASKAYASAVAGFVRQFHAAPLAAPKPPEQLFNQLAAAAAGPEIVQRFRRAQDAGQQCELEAQIRKRASSLAGAEQAALARYILIQ
jgi:hypothetical protein